MNELEAQTGKKVISQLNAKQNKMIDKNVEDK